MRKIKFRAWFKDKRLLMQFTGLKDKNGREIYEGDIVEFDMAEWYRHTGIPHGITHGPRFVVSWNEQDAGWDTGGGENSECHTWKTVVGNIHENPELLDQN